MHFQSGAIATKEKPAVVSDGQIETTSAKVTSNAQNASSKNELPQFVRDMLASVPAHGSGVHSWLFKMARVLHPYRDKATIADILRAAVDDCGRGVPPKEIADAIANSEAVAWKPGLSPTASPLAKPRQSAWPQRDEARRTAVIAESGGFSLYDLWESSPVRFDDEKAHSEEIIDALFPKNAWLCCGKSAQVFATRKREKWRGRLSEFALIVPSPMTARTGQTQDGRESQHTLANTGERGFLVTEFDSATQDEQAALLLHLSRYLPLTLVVHSGGKSLHGWLFVKGVAEDRLRRFMDYAVSIGADRATWLRSQFVRMPDGTRDDGKYQRVYFFNPSAMNGGAQ